MRFKGVPFTLSGYNDGPSETESVCPLFLLETARGCFQSVMHISHIPTSL